MQNHIYELQQINTCRTTLPLKQDFNWVKKDFSNIESIEQYINMKKELLKNKKTNGKEHFRTLVWFGFNMKINYPTLK